MWYMINWHLLTVMKLRWLSVDTVTNTFNKIWPILFLIRKKLSRSHREMVKQLQHTTKKERNSQYFELMLTHARCNVILLVLGLFIFHSVLAYYLIDWHCDIWIRGLSSFLKLFFNSLIQLLLIWCDEA